MSASAGPSSQYGDQLSADLLAGYRERHGKPPALGCSLVAHRDIGFCAACTENGVHAELSGWRLLAMADRGIPLQPWEQTTKGSGASS